MTTSKKAVSSKSKEKHASKAAKKLVISKGEKSVLQKKRPVCDSTVDEAAVDYDVKCRSINLVNIINNLTEEQSSAIRSIGFGGLLDLRVTKLPKEIIPWFLDAFDEKSYLFKVSGSRFVLSKEDVYDCFCLPTGPKDLDLVGTSRSKLSQEEESKTLKDRWRQRYNITRVGKSIPLGKLCDDLKVCREASDDFKRLFVLYSMSVFLAPTSNSQVDLKLLKAVEDVDSISQFDWCKYVFECLIKAIGGAKKDRKMLCGCIYILMIAYFHRYAYKGKEMASDLPLIQHWDNNNFIERAKMELAGTSLGDAILSSVAYPICKKRKVDSVDDDHVLRFHPKKKGKRSSKQKFIMLDLPDGVDDDEEIQNKAVDDVHELFLKIKQYSEVFHETYIKTISEIRRKLAERVRPTSTSTSSPTVELTPTQAFFADPDFHRYVDEVVEISKSMKSATKKIPPFQRLSQLVAEYGNKSNELGGVSVEDEGARVVDVTRLGADINEGVEGSSNVSEKAIKDTGRGIVIEEVHACMNADPLNELGGEDVEAEVGPKALVGSPLVVKAADPTCLLNRVLGDLLPSDHNIQKSGDVFDREEAVLFNKNDVVGHKHVDVPSSTVLHHPFLFHSSKLISSMIIVPENLGCSIDCGVVDPNQTIVSKCLLENKDLFSPVLRVRKQVMDYCFTSDHTFAKNEQLSFYGVTHFLSREDVESLLPDNEILMNTDLMGIFLNDNNLTKGLEVCKFPLLVVPFNWHQIDEPNLDCGLFLMLHMLLYCGKASDCDLGNPQSRILYRAEVAATLMLSDINDLRPQLLLRIEKFENEKQSLLPKLLDLRKQVAEKVTANENVNLGEEVGEEDEERQKKGENRESDDNEVREAREGNVETPTKGVKRKADDDFEPDSAKFSKSVLGSRSAKKSHGLGCTYDSGDADSSSLLVSKFMRENKDVFSEMAILRKDVLDYCFLQKKEIKPGYNTLNFL
ncbi:hypothetical protein RND81_03G008100 [Saponaria officinalis]|uniref:Aminotransferase-like plant mobile domain-containing protein n=1 Tax=Saponaria officinalis TaxID=3572 RepID=A0AAW1M2W1_SAPOF